MEDFLMFNTLEDGKYPDAYKDNYHGHILCRNGEMRFDAKTISGGTGVVVVGARPGEKLYETLLTKEEGVRAVDMGGFYRIPAAPGGGAPVGEYNSHNAPRLTLDQIKAKLEEAIKGI